MRRVTRPSMRRRWQSHIRDAVGIAPSPDIRIAPPAVEELPDEFQPRSLRRRALQAVAALGLLLAIVLLTPGLGDVRSRLADADPGWLALAVLLEGLSFASYVVMLGPIFCTG